MLSVTAVGDGIRVGGVVHATRITIRLSAARVTLSGPKRITDRRERLFDILDCPDCCGHASDESADYQRDDGFRIEHGRKASAKASARKVSRLPGALLLAVRRPTSRVVQRVLGCFSWNSSASLRPALKRSRIATSICETGSPDASDACRAK